MKNKFILLISLFSLTLFSSACEDTFNLIEFVDGEQLEEQGNKLVINGYISPQDSVVRIKVSRSQPLINKVIDYSTPWSQRELVHYVKDAQVMLSDGEQEIELNYTEEIYPSENGYDDTHIYSYLVLTESFPIVAGKTYTVTVTSTEGEVATASTYVPLQPAPFQAETKIVEEAWPECPTCPAHEQLKLDLQWEDNPETEDTYSIIGEMENRRTFKYDNNKEYTEYFKHQVDYWAELDKGFIEDKNLKSSTIRMQFYLGNTGLSPMDTMRYSQNPEPELERVHIEQNIYLSLLKIGDDYKKYIESEEAYYVSQENPFAEPASIYSNVENGYGLFAGYNRRVQTIEIVNFVYEREETTE